MLTPHEAELRVAKGAAHLDAIRPGWFHRIDVGTLTLHDPCGCIVGQLCTSRAVMDWDGASFSTAQLLELRLIRRWHDVQLMRETTYDGRVAALGFDLFHAELDDDGDDFAVLQDAWIAAIADRKLKADVSMPVEVSCAHR